MPFSLRENPKKSQNLLKLLQFLYNVKLTKMVNWR